MEKHRALGESFIERLEKDFSVTRTDTGSDSRLSKNGMVFTTETYDIGDIGHLCVLSMNAMLGLMKMETVVMSAFDRDVPLVNLDWVKAFGKETQLAELYDCQIEQYPQELLDEFAEVGDNDRDISDYVSAPAWYDDILYPCSYRKTGKGMSERLSSSASRIIDIFCRQLRNAPECDCVAKKEKIRNFAETLLAKGGPAVNQVKKLFGDETARRLIVEHMYGIKN